jgi:ABC-2 type transport system ATP-binding protein
MANGRMVKEGPLSQLIAVENQTEFVIENASPELLAQIKALVPQGQLLRMGQPHTTLERLFLKETGEGNNK